MTLCHRCRKPLEEAEARTHAGETLCEDCYMDVLSPPRTCDPWAVFTASRLKEQRLSPCGEKIVGRVRLEPRPTFEELMQITGLEAKALEREIAALRHAELIKAVMLPGGEKGFAPFQS